MAFASGTRIGPYEIAAQIGAGGMGEVYRATDTNLNRQVAIKVLPESVADDVERLARFQREAQILAALNHPNIAQIHGLEKSHGTTALVMELVEGPTLADRIVQGAVPVSEALAIGKQIAEALEAAHEQGIVHRDLKPANIKVRPDGTVKVLDFGLAKAVETTAAAAAAGVSHSPTITTPARTQAGLILGTAAYMSPEQAKGRSVDKRADVWALGCVVYEMLTGQRAFPGSDIADVLGAVIHKEPAWDALPATLSPVLGRFLRQCLHKSPAERVRDMGDLRLALEGAFDARASIDTPGRGASAWSVAAGIVLTAVVSALVVWNARPEPIRSVTRFAHELPAEQSFTSTARSHVAVAPDGSSVVYVANNRLYRRTMGDFEAAPIRGTDGAPSAPFFAPDGRTIAFWDNAAKQVRAVAIGGGTPVALASASSFYSASWGVDDAIVYAQENGIWRVAADGGTPEHIVKIESGERVHGPHMLPDGRTILYTLVSVASLAGNSTAWDNAEVIAQALDSGERTMLVRGSDARYVPTGHLVYAMGNTLLAVRFDPANRAITGRPIPIVEHVQRPARTPGSSGSANYDFSRDGTLAYVAFREPSPEANLRRLVAVDVKGNATPLLDEQRNYWRPRVSPDGGRIAVEVLEGAGDRTQLWIVDPARKSASPLTSEDEETPFIAWTPDSRSVIYRSNRGGRLGIHRQAADGSGDAEVLLQSDDETVPTDVSRDGVLVFAEGPQTGERSIRLLRLGEKSAADFLDTPALEHMAVFSPDGKWIAYASDESGRMEVYVRPYPKAPGVGRLVSLDGGTGPVWAPDGRMLYYRGASGDLMAVSTTLTPSFSAGRPERLFRFANVFRVSGNAAAYDVHPDGSRFIMVTEPVNQTPPVRQIHIIENWFEELKRLVPVN